jgi:hypothetical protein
VSLYRLGVPVAVGGTDEDGVALFPALRRGVYTLSASRSPYTFFSGPDFVAVECDIESTATLVLGYRCGGCATPIPDNLTLSGPAIGTIGLVRATPLSWVGCGPAVATTSYYPGHEFCYWPLPDDADIDTAIFFSLGCSASSTTPLFSLRWWTNSCENTVDPFYRPTRAVICHCGDAVTSIRSLTAFGVGTCDPMNMTFTGSYPGRNASVVGGLAMWADFYGNGSPGANPVTYTVTA